MIADEPVGFDFQSRQHRVMQPGIVGNASRPLQVEAVLGDLLVVIFKQVAQMLFRRRAAVADDDA